MKRQRRNPFIVQRELRKNQPPPKPSGQAAPPPPPPSSTPEPPKPTTEQVDNARQALETLPDAELKQKAEVLLPDYDEGWDRTTLIDKLIAAGVAG